MLGRAMVDSLSPHFPATKLHFLTHEFYYIGFGHPKLYFYGIKGRSVFPGHFHNTVYLRLA
jgi:hypothetical protein